MRNCYYFINYDKITKQKELKRYLRKTYVSRLLERIGRGIRSNAAYYFYYFKRKLNTILNKFKSYLKRKSTSDIKPRRRRGKSTNTYNNSSQLWMNYDLYLETHKKVGGITERTTIRGIYGNKAVDDAWNNYTITQKTKDNAYLKIPAVQVLLA